MRKAATKFCLLSINIQIHKQHIHRVKRVRSKAIFNDVEKLYTDDHLSRSLSPKTILCHDDLKKNSTAIFIFAAASRHNHMHAANDLVLIRIYYQIRMHSHSKSSSLTSRWGLSAYATE
jgi:hypothetical protein